MSGPPVNRVYIGNLPENTREDDLQRAFDQCGRIVEITVKRFFAFIDFERRDDMMYAIERFNNSRFLNQKISVEVAKGIKRDTSGQMGYDGHNGAGHYSNGTAGGYRQSRRRTPPPYHSGPSGAGSYAHSSGGYGSGSHSNSNYSSGSSAYNRSGSNYPNSYSASRGPKHESRKLSYRVIVLNLPKHAQWGQLKDFMKQAGDVNYVSCNDIIAKVGIVEFEHSKDIKNCIRMFDKTKFMDNTIYIIDPESYCKSLKDKNHDSDNKYLDDQSKNNLDGASYNSADELSKTNSESLPRSRSPKSNRSLSQDSRDPLPDVSHKRNLSRSPNTQEPENKSRNYSKESDRSHESKRSYASYDDEVAVESPIKNEKLSD